MKKPVTANALRIRLIRKLTKEGKTMRRHNQEWLVIAGDAVVERYDSIGDFATKYEVIKPYEDCSDCR